jgi:hypothetical protein
MFSRAAACDQGYSDLRIISSQSLIVARARSAFSCVAATSEKEKSLQVKQALFRGWELLDLLA